MALLSSKSAVSDINGDVLSVSASAHADTHTIVVKPSGGATGTVDINIKCVGGNFEPLKRGTSQVTIDLADPISEVAIACIAEVQALGNTVSGSYTLTVNSHGTAPEGRD